MDSTLLYNCALEFLGTLILVLLGDGVCACMGLNKSKGQGGGWIVITLGWGLAVMAGVFVAHASGAHLNPAVSIGLAAAGLFPWENVLPYSVAQMIGGFVGAILVWIMYKDHFDASSAWPVTMVIVSIGMSLGGVTGYAMNPARDLSPRIAHAILPMKGKRDSGWGYSWVPVLGPIAGAVLAALVASLYHFC